MTGGAYDYSDDAFVDKMFTNPEHILSWKEVLDRAYYHIPNTDFAPGTKLEYSNTNYTLAGLIIERVTHKTFKENLETRISRPLGLKHTLYDPNLIPSHLSNMVHGYWEIQIHIITLIRLTKQ